MNGYLISKDFVFSSKLVSAARHTGISLTQIASAQALARQFAQSPDSEPCYFVMIDLDSPGIEIGEEVRQLRNSAMAPATIVAFGPHVHQAKLAAAKAAGCDAVITRGQLSRDLPSLLRQLAETGTPD